MRRSGCLILSICVPLLAWSARSEAQASATDKAAAEVLFERGRQLNRDGRYAEACARFEQSEAIEPSLGTLLYLADCYEKLGRSASAWALFLEASSHAAAAGQIERAHAGKSRAALLEPKLSTLTVVVAPENDVPRLEILRNGSSIGRELWGVPIPVDAGDYVIEARAPNRKTWSTTVHLDAAGARITVTIPSLNVAPSHAAPLAAVKPASALPTLRLPKSLKATGETPSADEPASAMKVLGVTAAALGAASLIVGGIFGLRAISKNNAAGAYCSSGGGPVCRDKAGVDLSDEANHAAVLANVLVFGGAGLVVGGAVLYFSAPEASDQARFGIALGHERVAVRVRGTF